MERANYGVINHSARRHLFQIFVGAILLAPTDSWGCGLCVWANTWNVLPPIIPWSILSVGWFVSLSLLAKRKKQELVLIPQPSTAVGLAVAGSVLAGVITGPITMFPLVVPCLINTVSSMSKSLSPHWTPTFRKGVQWTGTVAIVAMTFFAIHDVKVKREMDIADRIMAWQGTMLERKLLTELEKKEPESLDQYRKLMREASGSVLWLTAKRVAEVGEAEVDVPNLIEALGSDRSDGGQYGPYGIERETIELALRELTGLSLPEETSPKEWEREWSRKLENSESP